MVEVNDIFYIIYQQQVSPPVLFPESIINGFGFAKPIFLHYNGSSIQFTEINQSDSECIKIWWNTAAQFPILIKTSNKLTFQTFNNTINIYQKNTIFQQFIKEITNGKFRIFFHKKNGTKIQNCNTLKFIFNSRHKTNKISQNLEKVFKLQLDFIIKCLNKILYFSYGYEIKEIELDFIQASELYFIGIHSFDTSPILSLQSVQSFQSLLKKPSILLNSTVVLKNKTGNKGVRKMVRRDKNGNNYMENLKTLTKQMRVIMAEHKAKTEFMEAVRGQVDGIIANSKVSDSEEKSLVPVIPHHFKPYTY